MTAKAGDESSAPGVTNSPNESLYGTVEGELHSALDRAQGFTKQSMLITRRIYVSLPADPWLSPNLNELKWGIVEEIEKLGYTPEIFKLHVDASVQPSLACRVGISRMYRASLHSYRRSSTTTKGHSPERWVSPPSSSFSGMSVGELSLI